MLLAFLFGAAIGVVSVALYVVHDIRRRRSQTVVIMHGRVIGRCPLIEVPKGASMGLGLSCDYGPNHEMIVRSVMLDLTWNEEPNE